MFSTLSQTNFTILATFKLSSANVFLTKTLFENFNLLATSVLLSANTVRMDRSTTFAKFAADNVVHQFEKLQL